MAREKSLWDERRATGEKLGRERVRTQRKVRPPLPMKLDEEEEEEWDDDNEAVSDFFGDGILNPASDRTLPIYLFHSLSFGVSKASL